MKVFSLSAGVWLEVTDWATTESEEGKLIIRAEDTMIGVVRRIPVDMVVLSVGLEPGKDAQDIRRNSTFLAQPKVSSLKGTRNLLQLAHSLMAYLLQAPARDLKIFPTVLHRLVQLLQKHWL